jgi:hypothetical protein
MRYSRSKHELALSSGIADSDIWPVLVPRRCTRHIPRTSFGGVFSGSPYKRTGPTTNVIDLGKSVRLGRGDGQNQIIESCAAKSTSSSVRAYVQLPNF